MIGHKTYEENKLDKILSSLCELKNKYPNRQDYNTLSTFNGIFRQIKTQSKNDIVYINYLKEINIENIISWEVVEETITHDIVSKSILYNYGDL